VKKFNIFENNIISVGIMDIVFRFLIEHTSLRDFGP
jgi:hypothetical protein